MHPAKSFLFFALLMNRCFKQTGARVQFIQRRVKCPFDFGKKQQSGYN